MQISEMEKAKQKEFGEKEALVKADKELLLRLNYLIPELAKKHSNLMKLNTSNCDESAMMANYRKFKEVEAILDKIKTEYDENKREQETLTKRVKLISDKILLINTEELIRTKENEILMQTEELKHLAGKVEKEKQMTNEFIKLTANVSNLEGKDETHKKSAQEYYDKIYRNRDKEMQYFERLTHYEYYRMLVDDLELYMQSLEEALVKYHKEKIELINKNIAELWKMTYQNGDIKRIEIKAEQIMDGNVENKGNFNYRVVFYNKE
jgi:DNA repair protein RAD50